MWVERLELKNIRSFAQATLTFSRGLNVLVGQNNTGKSTILLPLLALQKGLRGFSNTDHRLAVGNAPASAEIDFSESAKPYFGNDCRRITFVSAGQGFDVRGQYVDGHKEVTVGKIQSDEPHNFIYPFLSMRKVKALDESVNLATVRNVPATFTNLNAKIDRVSDPSFEPAYERYMQACEEIVGFRISMEHTGSGKRAVLKVGEIGTIPLLAMGEGIVNILGLVTSLVTAKNALFILEEPENDIHPRALKRLLDLVIQRSKENQFIVTTHSNIVLKTLGAAEDAKVFRFDLKMDGQLPTSAVTEVPPNSESRRAILQDLGYEFGDIDLWDGWLILEESSAEKIIRDYLIPVFVPSLRPRLKTFSAHSISEVDRKFRYFNDLFVFLHLQPAYKNRAWVLVDGGEEEKKVVQKLASLYENSGWNPERFLQLEAHDFEHYYPEQFEERREEVLSQSDKQARREGKRRLLQEVEDWVKESPEEAKTAFAESAGEVIQILRRIEAELGS